MSFEDSYDDGDPQPGADDGIAVEEPLPPDPVADLETAPGLDGSPPATAPAPEATTGPDDTAGWHEQQATHSCAVVSQEFLLDRFTGVDHTEEELAAVAEAHGWYRPGVGTPLDDVGNLLEYYDVPVERSQGESLDSLASALSAGEGVLVALDSDELLAADPESLELADAAGIPDQGADHVVQVIGFDRSDPDDPRVVLNDPGRPDGAGLEVPEADFLRAWDDSQRLTVTAGGNRHA
ncbi:hypothetical protein [Streptomyces sp. NPDC020607]|uniref:hypothetical protein n=1 Tax=Streptomyces sp. NPDC020607 TaxID=3365082 RepID=UPI00379C9B63